MSRSWLRFWLVVALVVPLLLVSFPEKAWAPLHWFCQKCGRDLGPVGMGPAPRTCPFCNGMGNFNQSGGGGTVGAVSSLFLLVGVGAGMAVLGGIVIGFIFFIRAITATSPRRARNRSYRSGSRRRRDEDDYDDDDDCD